MVACLSPIVFSKRPPRGDLEMVWRAPLRAGTRCVRLVGGTVYSMLDVGHGMANVVVRLSLALFCFGLVLQALSSKFRAGVADWLVAINGVKERQHLKKSIKTRADNS